MTIYNHTRNTTRSRYDPPSVPSAFQQLNTTIQSENKRNNKHQTSSQHYDPINYSFFPPSNTNIQTVNTQNISQLNNSQRTQHPYAHLLQTNKISLTKSKNILFKHCTRFSKKIPESSTFSYIY